MFKGKIFQRIGTACLACLLVLTCLLCPAAQAGGGEGDWICPTCGRNNTAEMNFCGGCRTAKPAIEIVPSDDINAWVCSGCSHICPAGDLFCTKCGTDHYDTDRPAIQIDKTVPEEIRMNPCSTLRIEDEYCEKKKDQWRYFYSYVYTAPTKGWYSFWLEGQTPAYKGQLELFDLNGQALYTQDFSHNSPQTSYWFKQGEQVKIRVEAGDLYTGSFTLCIGEPREIPGIQAPCVIADSVDYVEQCNIYRFAPEADGQYMLELTEIRKGQELKMMVLDELGYTIAATSFGSGMGTYLQFDVKAGKQYSIRVWQYAYLGPYKVSLFCPKPVVRVSGAEAIGDSVYYRGQKNTYEYIAPFTANYTFSIGYADPETQLSICVEDLLGNRLSSGSGNSCTAELKAGQTYVIRVEQKNGIGAYTVLIDHDYVEPEPGHARTDAEMALMGKTVRFGSYEQDHQSGNGAETLEWIVLDAREGKALLLSRYGLDARPYHAAAENVTWENSTMRYWLNADFLDAAFSAAEQAAILTTDVDNSNAQGASYWSRTEGGNNTQDKVFLLSWHEAEELYFSNSAARICAPTDHAAAQGAWYVEDYVLQGYYEVDGRPAGYWWLRSPGMFQYEAASVSESGDVASEQVNRSTVCLRPAIWVDLNQVSF